MQGIIHAVHGNQGSTKPRVKSADMEQWLEEFIDSTGDYMPHKSEIHLFVGSIKNLYDQYERYCRTHEIEFVVAMETLRVAFRSIGDYVKIPKTKLFAQCDECSRLTLAVQSAKTKTSKRAAVIEKGLHIDWQTQERKVYWHHRFLAKTRSNEYACIIIDGMDQQKTNLPRFSKRVPKTCDNLEQLGVTIVGSLIHGHSPMMHIMPNDFKKDCNVTIQVLLSTLRHLAKQRKGRPWPHTLFLQLDGAGDNKNKHLLSLLAHLVRLGIFKKVICVNCRLIGKKYSILELKRSLSTPNVILNINSSSICPFQSHLNI